MKKTLVFSLFLVLAGVKDTKAQETKTVAHFDKVIVSPHVQATFIKGDSESVKVISCTVAPEKINMESKSGTLRVYLEGAKEVTKNEKSNQNGNTVKNSIYKGTVLIVEITYKTLEELSVRGEETTTLASKLDQDNFSLILYGEGKTYVNDVKLKNMHTTIYGECYLELKAGAITEQKFTIYGESKINALAISNNITRCTCYGEAELNVNVADQLKVTAFGEARVGYKGDPQIRKGLNIGEVKIFKIR